MNDTTEEIPTPSDTARADARVDWAVAAPALILIIGIAAWSILLPDNFRSISGTAFEWLVKNVGWLFVTMASVFFFSMFAIAVSKNGRIKLGRDDEEPEFSTVSWVAMMFAAGMGIGLLFYGAYEPLSHFRNGVPGHPESDQGTAFAQTLMHWGPVAWATYAVVGAGIAYGTFRLNRPQLISAACIPLIGVRRAEGLLGKVIDSLAIFVTVFGTAMSLGLGAGQIGAGMESIGWISDTSIFVMLLVIGILSIGYLASAMSGVARGVQWLSNANMIMAALIALFIFIVGPTLFILNTIPDAIGSFLSQSVTMLGRTAASENGTAAEWMGNWTIFYWVWWVSWTPFVGMFLARISRGRTIREFVIGIVLVPSVLTLIWFAIFGGTSIHYEQIGDSIWGEGNPEAMLFEMLGRMPWSGALSVLAMVLLGTFFITTADSASTVMGSMSQRGRVNPTPWVSGMWGLMTTIIACAILLSGGTDILSSLQIIIIVAGSPFLIIVTALLVSLVIGLRTDPANLDEKESRKFMLRLHREQKIREKKAGVHTE